jgi:tripartite-type tricarboxylate transporter receptor subunit TctC
MSNARSMNRRRVLAGLAASALAGSMHGARAQGYPARLVKITVPYAPGGSPDTVARILSQYLPAFLGQAVAVENIPGSSGISAIEAVRSQPADGHAVLMADAAHWAINRAMRPRLPRHFQQELEPISLTASSSLFLAVHESFPAANLRELVAAIRARPGVYSYGSSGVGSLHHLAMETFKAGLGLDLLHVPYRGTGQSVPALVAAQVSMAVAAYNSVAPFARAGKVKIIAATTREPSTLLPQFPPMGDTGLRDFDFPGENALFVPSGTPRPVIDTLLTAIVKVLALPEAMQKYHAAGVEAPRVLGPAALVETMRRDVQRYAQAVKVAGIQPE